MRVLIIDDASTDETADIGADLARRDPRVSFRRHQNNMGHIETYNEGVAWTQNEYMLVLSADDFLLPGAVRRAVDVFDAHPEVGLVWGPAIVYREGNRPALPPPVPDFELLEAGWFIRTLAVGNSVPMSAAFTRTRVQKHLGGYRKDLPHAGDLEMWLRFALHSKVAMLKATQLAYRRHDGNMSLGYSGWPDLQQCRLAFHIHYPDIRSSLRDGAAVEAFAREKLATKILKLAKAAQKRGDLDKMRNFLGEALRELP
jgi:glycosyltransferase involved in cell wall biosynthesis